MENLIKTAQKGFGILTGKRTWQSLEYFDAAWTNRIKEMASYIPKGASVLDLGCGQMWTKQYLHQDSAYFPVDYTDRGGNTIVCDFNKKEFPVQHADMAFVSGTLEYIKDARWFVDQIAAHCDQCAISYCLKEYHSGAFFRRAQAWVNNFSHKQIIKLFTDAGFQLETENSSIANNRIFYFTKES